MPGALSPCGWLKPRFELVGGQKRWFIPSMQQRSVWGTGFATMLAVACGGGDASQTGTPDARDAETSSATWYGGVQALMIRSCSSCHTNDGIGPFPLDDYESSKAVAASVVAATASNRMPPWLAQDTDECAPPLPWQDDIRLSDDDKELLAEWLAAGTPLGDPNTAVPVPEAPNFDIVDPSIEMTFQQPFAVSGERDLFECFVLDPQLEEDVWITAVQMQADNSKVDHHAIIFLDPEGASAELATDGHFPCFSSPDIDGSLIGAWAPGALPFTIPESGGIPMPKESRVVVQMHYHPIPGTTEMDQSSLSIKTTNVRPDYDAVLALLGNYDDQNEDGTGLQPGPGDRNEEPEFRIPAFAEGHVENLIYRQEIPFAIPIFGVGAHMHYVGTEMKIDLVRAEGNGDDDCLLHTPVWDFDWQRSYNYDAAIEDLPVMRPGDELHLRCTYDNSMNNPAVAAAVNEQGLNQPVDVYLGEETLDEMCLGVFGALVPSGLLD